MTDTPSQEIDPEPPLPPPIPSKRSVPKSVIAVLILVAGCAAGFLAFKTKPEVEKKEDIKEPPLVKTATARKESMRIPLLSQGLIEPRKRSPLAAEVGGKVIWVSNKFKAGGEFEADEPLLRIDPADYDDAIAQAKAAVAEAELNLATEKARSEQAKRDWERLGNEGEAGDLTLRKPHVARAEAQLASAQSARERARRDRERTEIKAPFAGRLEAIHTELGAFLPPGSPVAGIYTTAPYEIRLPLSLDEWTLVERDGDGDPVGEVIFDVRAGGEHHQWKGRIVRAEGLVERESRSFHVVARIGEDSRDPAESLIQPGLFVKAEVGGKILEGVFQIPAGAFRSLDEVMIVKKGTDGEGNAIDRLHTRKVNVLRRLANDVLVTGGIEDGDRLATTELSDVIEGMTVRISEAAPEDGKLTGEPTPKP